MTQGAGRGRSRWLVPFVAGSFMLTVLSFVISTIVTEARARGIEEAAESIATNAMPSVMHLTEERNDLRLIEGLAIEYAHRVAVGDDARNLVPRIKRAREMMAEQWALEQETPLYPHEIETWTEIREATEDFDAAVARILAADVRGGGSSVQELIYGDLRPSVDRLSRALLADVQVNATNAKDLAGKIQASRTQQRILSGVLDGASAVFAVIAGLAVARVLRGYTAMMSTRITELERFSGRVAHDIRSPLMVVSFAVELARKKSQDDPSLRAMLDRAERSIQRVGHIVDAMLVLARADTPPEEGARVEVRALAKEGIDELSAEAREKNVDLVLDPFDPVEVACAPGVLVSILSNLIGNAIKYIDDVPVKRVRVSATVRGEKVRVEVADSGPGVPADQRARIFEPYVRAASSSIPGLGLGLAAVKRLAEAHGGSVGVEPSPEGGSLFWVELPRAS